MVLSIILTLFNHTGVSSQTDSKIQQILKQNLVIIDEELKENDLIFDSNYLVQDGKSLTCFLSAGYSDNESSMDEVMNVKEYHQEGVRFYFFTNEEAKNAVT